MDAEQECDTVKPGARRDRIVSGAQCGDDLDLVRRKFGQQFGGRFEVSTQFQATLLTDRHLDARHARTVHQLGGAHSSSSHGCSLRVFANAGSCGFCGFCGRP
ncbi:hypothetical protein D9M71_818750 [compost metagenome]